MIPSSPSTATFRKPALLAVALLAVACGGRLDAPDVPDAATDAATGDAGSDSPSIDHCNGGVRPENSLSVTLDGTPIQAKSVMWQKKPPSSHGDGDVISAFMDNDVIVSLGFPAAAATNSCPSAELPVAVVLISSGGTSTKSANHNNSPPGTCSVVITGYGAPGEGITGNFSAIVVDEHGSSEAELADGLFHVIRCK